MGEFDALDRGRKRKSPVALQNGGIVAVMLKRSGAVQTITLNWADPGVPTEESLAVRDLWEHKHLGSRRGKSTPAPTPSHGTMMLTLKP